MIEFTGYASLDDLMDDMRQAEEAANSNLLPSQIELRDNRDENCYWYRQWDGLDIWGIAWSDARCHESSIEAGCTPDEAAAERQQLMEARRRGYVFGRCFSVIEPQGELGSIHVSQVVPISAEIMAFAESYAWGATREHDLSRILRARINEVLQEDRRG